MSARRLATTVLALCVAAGVWVGGTLPGGRAAETGAGTRAEVGQTASDLALPSLDGGSVELASYRGRKSVLINFWATWCGPCRQEMPALDRLRRERRETLEVIGVSLDRTGAARVRAFVREVGVTFPILLDPEATSARAYRVRGLPTTVIVGVDGVVRHRELGYRDWDRAESRALVDAVIRPR